ncbi:unnamed protein product [Rotaria socialis]|uniref:HTH CENPB-type domain-containing protein n=1 Tax=Rotaria socialis TaxID=392032 RepID=A0A821DBH5_9BILA|nr:unnamed protein product [Rotaria socialis]CAF4576433.1 unnamed protein product [Rotaria socialis]CAF4617864.1 unnamed protein product [Rotaria socialis]
MSKKYTHQALVDAVASDMDSKAASIEFKVPASTIRQHRREPTLNIRAGRSSYLNSDEESHFVSLLQLLPEYGFDVAKNLALQLAAEYFESLKFTTQPGFKWLNVFVKRHFDDIIWKKQEELERARAEAFTEQNRSGWFKTLKDVLIKHDLFDKPNQIFNADESGFSDKTKGQWVIVNSSCRHAFESNGGTGKDYRTALICIAASGQVLPPLLIYAGQRLINTCCRGGLEGAHCGVTKKAFGRSMKMLLCHKVANNTSIYPTTQSSSIHHVPTNILQPCLLCATPSMSSNSTTISCSSTSSSYSPTVLTNKSIDTSTNIDQLPLGVDH